MDDKQRQQLLTLAYAQQDQSKASFREHVKHLLNNYPNELCQWFADLRERANTPSNDFAGTMRRTEAYGAMVAVLDVCQQVNADKESPHAE